MEATVSLDVRSQFVYVSHGRLTKEGREYLEDVYRAKTQELAALRRMLGYSDEKVCPQCGFVRKRV